MIMVITLKSGRQLRFPVTEFEVGKSGLDGSLGRLKWTAAEGGAKLSHVNLDDVSAIHREDGEA